MQPERVPDAQDGLPQPRRFWALLTLVIAVVMTVLDGAIANVALPRIATLLHAAPSDSIWIVNAYQAALMVLLLPFASAGEIIGYRRVSQAGMAVFTIASLACALSTTLALLVAARVLQGVGAAMLLSVNSALLRHIYPRSMLGRGIGLMALTVGVSASVAPSVASAILSVADWPWLFAVNVPLGLLAFAIARTTLPRTPTVSERFDWFSAILTALALGPFVIGIDGFAHSGQRGQGLAAFGLSLAAGVLLVRRQSARIAPLLPVDLLRIPAFAMAIVTSVCSFCAQSLAFIGMPFLLEYGLGRGQVVTGLLMTPWPLVTGIAAPFAGRLADRHSAGLLAGIGMVILACSALGLALLPQAPGNLLIAVWMGVGGLGFGLFQSPNNRAMLSAAPRARAGGASGMLGTARTTGQTVGAALVALIFGAIGPHAARAALAAAAAIAAIAAAVSLSRLKVLRQ